MEKLRTYLNTLSVEQQATFALSCGTTINYLRKAISAGQVIGAVTCVSIERESSGAVTRKDLRPKDWVAIWPELGGMAVV